MAKKYFQRALSVGLSLALCASMVAPGFAASFKDLQNAIDGKTSEGIDLGDGRWGYGGQVEDTDNYAVEATTGQDDEGNDTRFVTLYEDVEAEEGESGISIGGDKNVTLDLNGKAIDLNPGWKLQDDCFLNTSNPLIFENTNTGEKDKNGYELNQGSVITVNKNATLTLNDSSEAEGATMGKITGGNGGSGVLNYGTFVMNKGEISGNNSYWGGGVENTEGGKFTMNGGVIRKNINGVENGGQLGSSTASTFIMNGGKITENRAYTNIVHNNSNSTFVMNGGEIIGNTHRNCAEYDSCFLLGGGTAYLLDGTIHDNETGTDGGDLNVDFLIFSPKCYKTSKNLIPYDKFEALVLPADEVETIKTALENEDKVEQFPAGSTVVTQASYHDPLVETTWLGGVTMESKYNGWTTDYYFVGQGEKVVKTIDWDKVIITDTQGNSHEISGVNSNNVTVGTDGTTTVPEGGKITDDKGNETTYPDGTTIDKNGNITGGSSVTKDKETGDVTIDDGQGNKTNVDVPDGTNPDDVKVDKNGTTTVPGGTTVTGKDEDGKTTETELPNGGTIDKDGNVTGDPVITKKDNDDGKTTDVTVTDGEGKETEVTVPTDKKDDVKVDDNGTITVPGGSTATDKDGNKVNLPYGGTIDKDGNITRNPNPNAGGFTDVTGSTDVVVIDGVEVPLAGLVSVEDVLDVLYRLAEGVDGEHDDVIAWAVENGIIDEETDVEELVTVAALRSILANYARAFQLDVDVTTLATLAGEDDDIVMNCDEVIGEFFAKAEEDEAA